MPKIIFASNNASHFPGAVVGSAVGSFDSNRVPYGVSFTNYSLGTSPTFTAATGTSTWFHFMTHSEGAPYNLPNGAQGIMWQCFDSAGRMIARITKANATYAHVMTLTLYNGTTSVAVNGTLTAIVGRMTAIDIQVTVTALSLVVNLYVNGALSGTQSFGANPNLITNPVRFSLGTCFVDNTSTAQTFSEIIVADGDTRNARVNLLRPASSGAFSNWTGSVASLGDDDSVTGIQTKLANQRFTAALSAYTGSSTISNLVSVSQTSRGVNSPTRLKHTIRLSGVNYDSEEMVVSNSLQYNIVDLTINPATSLPFTASDLSSIETGFLSVA